MLRRQDEFERVAMPHTRSLFRVARRVTSDPTAAEDLVQETMLLAWRGFDQFLPGSNARAWLFRIMFNAHYSAGRKMQAAPVMIELSAREPASSLAGLNSSVANSMIDAMDVTHALADLAEEHRTVLLLGVVEGFTCREIAEILALPIGTVMSRLSRARQALRARLAPSAPGLNEAAPRLCEAAPSTKCAARETQ
jgi:RNA polymerase sigma-70 factor (ECF subfamily)